MTWIRGGPKSLDAKNISEAIDNRFPVSFLSLKTIAEFRNLVGALSLEILFFCKMNSYQIIELSWLKVYREHTKATNNHLENDTLTNCFSM